MAVQDEGAHRWSRRAVLGAAVLAGAASTLPGCDWISSSPADPPPPDPLEPLLESTRELVMRYGQVRATHPELAGALAPLHEAHTAHVATLLELIGRPEPASPSPGATSTPPPTDAGVPTEPDEAVADLREAEQQAYQDAAQACLAAPPERALLLGAICAARATHLEVLP